MTLSDLKPYGDFISICGALLIFFSWLATNTLSEKLNRAKSAFEAATDKRRLYSTLDEILKSNETVASHIINLRTDFLRLSARLDPRRGERAERDEHEELLLQYASTILSARQIDWGNSFCTIILDQPENSSKSSPAQAKLLESCAKINDLPNKKKAVIEQMGVNLARYSRSGEVSLREVATEQRRLSSTYKEILPSFGSPLGAAVDASNARGRELRNEYSAARAHSSQAKQASLYFYVIGTALVLTGTALAKLVT